jgi:hypothetical protein
MRGLFNKTKAVRSPDEVHSFVVLSIYWEDKRLRWNRSVSSAIAIEGIERYCLGRPL